MGDLTDEQALSIITQCNRGITALTELYGECPEEHYEDECVSCRAGRFIRDMRAMRDELRAEIISPRLPV